MKPAAKKSSRRMTVPAGPAAGMTPAQRVARLNRWREQYNPLRGLTLARAVALAESYFRGEMADYQWAGFFVEQTDPDLFALLEMRLGRIVEMDYSFACETDAEEAAAEEQENFLTEKFALIDNVSEAIEHLALAPFRGFAHLEQWRGDSGDLVHLEPVDQWNVVRDGLRGAWRYNPEARSTTYAALGAGADMPPEQFIFREVRRHINRIALFKFVRANLSEKDWDAFVEIFGFLGGVVIGPPGVDPQKAAEFAAEAEKVAEGGSGFLPNGSDYKVNPTAKGAHPFKERLDHLSEKLVLVGTGGKLTMLTEAGSGTLAGGAHADVFDQIAKAEAGRISECINRQIVAPLLAAAFPGKPQLAYFKLAANAETDTGAAVDEVQKLSSAGFLCDPAEVAERTGWKVTLKPAPAAPAQTPGSPRVGPNADAPADIQNRARAAGRETLYVARAAQQVSRAEAEALQPLLTRLAALETAAEAELPTLLNRLKADLPRLQAEAVARVPAVAAVWEAVLGAAVADGLVSAAAEKAAQKPDPAAQTLTRAQNRGNPAMQGHATPPCRP